VWDNSDAIICVTVYKCGAGEVERLLSELVELVRVLVGLLQALLPRQY
jgi:hypothetical protein